MVAPRPRTSPPKFARRPNNWPTAWSWNRSGARPGSRRSGSTGRCCSIATTPAHEVYTPTTPRSALRRLARPLPSYRDEDAGILEGGLFAFANGTNPELLLFIEARQGKGKSSKPVWQFGVGRASYAQLHAE